MLVARGIRANPRSIDFECMAGKISGSEEAQINNIDKQIVTKKYIFKTRKRE